MNNAEPLTPNCTRRSAEGKMKSTYLFTLFAALALTLTACSGGATPNATQAAALTATNAPATAAPTEPPPIPEPSPTPAAAPPEPISVYTLAARLDYAASFLSVEEQLTYVNHSGAALDELLLIVEPNRYFGGFTLKEITWDSGEAITDYALDGVRLTIQLPEALPDGESLSLSLAFDSSLPGQDAPYGRAERQTNVSDWYPYAPPYVPGEGWLVREDAFLGEHLAYDVADFNVSIELTSATSPAGRPLILAASALPSEEGPVYRYHLGAARNFVWTVSDQYLVQTTTAGDLTVTAYSFPGHQAADAAALETAAEALGLFDRIFSPYPHACLTVVESDFLDGMEFSGLIYLSHAFYDFYTGTPENNLVIIAAHEAAHQWWYGLVGNDQAMEPWLDEALATYSEVLYYEQAHPDLVDWWWQNRVYFHEPQGWVDSTIYEPAGFYPYRDAVYLQGALFIDALRQRMGEEAFTDFLHDYLNRYSYRQATGDDFFAVLGEHYSGDISDLTTQYFTHR